MKKHGSWRLGSGGTSSSQPPSPSASAGPREPTGLGRPRPEEELTGARPPLYPGPEPGRPHYGVPLGAGPLIAARPPPRSCVLNTDSPGTRPARPSRHPTGLASRQLCEERVPGPGGHCAPLPRPGPPSCPLQAAPPPHPGHPPHPRGFPGRCPQIRDSRRPPAPGVAAGKRDASSWVSPGAGTRRGSAQTLMSNPLESDVDGDPGA